MQHHWPLNSPWKALGATMYLRGDARLRFVEKGQGCGKGFSMLMWIKTPIFCLHPKIVH